MWLCMKQFQHSSHNLDEVALTTENMRRTISTRSLTTFVVVFVGFTNCIVLFVMVGIYTDNAGYYIEVRRTRDSDMPLRIAETGGREMISANAINIERTLGLPVAVNVTTSPIKNAKAAIDSPIKVDVNGIVNSNLGRDVKKRNNQTFNSSDILIGRNKTLSFNNVETAKNDSKKEEWLMDIFQNIRKNWTFNEKEASNLRSLLEEKCQTKEMFLTTQQNTPLNSNLTYEAERSTKIEVTAAVYKRFPKTMPYISESFNKCSIVGSSGILLNSTCGQSIDSSEFVVRFNLAHVQKFAKDVGSRTDLITCNPGMLKSMYGSVSRKGSKSFTAFMTREYPNATLLLPAFTYHFTSKLSFRAQDALKGQHLNVVYLHPLHHTMVKRFWKSQKVNEVRVSTGLLLFTSMMSFCKEVHLYGYWPFEEDPDGNPLLYHYFDEKAIMLSPRKLKRRIHNMPDEFDKYLTWHNKGAIRLHVGQCTAPP
ncbi:alpha-2,8-sialyltransferase 8E-like [Ptychodera flava]|uniref:alpha-2,8-sialyltransferase 8E-like n=1 Tax=Ptychodera flava TaxID=63121 RepID=UPI00396A036E